MAKGNEAGYFAASNIYIDLKTSDLHHRLGFASFLTGGFITATVANPPERKLAKLTSVQCTGSCSFLLLFLLFSTSQFEKMFKPHFELFVAH